MEYVKLQGDITPSLKIDNTPYSYAYWNNTFSPNSQTQTLAQFFLRQLQPTMGR